MDQCDNCGATLTRQWRYCVHCGAPLATRTQDSPVEHERSATHIPAATDTPAATHIPAAIRPEPTDEPPARRYDAAFWVGTSMGAVGLVLIVYAATQIFTLNG